MQFLFRRVCKISQSNYQFRHICLVSRCVRENGQKKVPTGWIFNEIWYLSIFVQSFEKIQFSLNSDKNNGYFT